MNLIVYNLQTCLFIKLSFFSICLVRKKANIKTKVNTIIDYAFRSIERLLAQKNVCFFTALHRHAVDWKFDISTHYARVLGNAYQCLH